MKRRNLLSRLTQFVLVVVCLCFGVVAGATLAQEPAEWFARTDAGFKVMEAGRPFLRLIAARFDSYLPRGAGRHSSAL